MLVQRSKPSVTWVGAAGLLMQLVAAGCAGDGTPSAGTDAAHRGSAANPTLPVAMTLPAMASAGAGSATTSAPVQTRPNNTPLAGAPMMPPRAGTAAPTMMTPPSVVMTPPMTAAPAPSVPAGPDDGDPSKPVVTISEVACKPANAAVLGLGAANFKMDNRDVIIDYPCNKHEGAPMTFILNLHGTSPVNTHFYQEGYFSAYKYLASHNLIIATPSAVDQQWGNMDNGQDLPYLMHVIDWVYKTFGTKFDIRSMWVGGHSWGAMYTATFGCKPELADKVRGLIIMSGSPTNPACASKMSVIDTNAEMDIAAPLNQGNVPMQHGCKDPQMMMLGNNTQTLWPGCNKGFVHSNYLMLGKMHTDFMDDVVVKSIVDLIKQARP